MIKKLVYMVIGILVVGGFFGLGWYTNQEKYDFTGPVSMKFTDEEKVGLKIDQDLIKEYAFAAGAKLGLPVKKVVMSFTQTIPQDGDKLALFWQKTIWGVSGLACGMPIYSSDNTTAKVNFYYSPENLVKELGQDEAKKLTNLYMRYCVAISLSGKKLGDEGFSLVFQSLEREYTDKNYVSF